MGSTAHFFFRFFLDSCHRPLNLGEILERTLPALGYELVDWESAARGGLVRVFIDKPAGIDVEDCARVSNHLTHLFAVEQVVYERLEVSSPGLDRPLKKLSDFVRFVGEEVKLTLRESVDNAKRIKGVLRGVDGDSVLVDTDAGRRTIALASIDKARLVPRIEWRNTK
jgi:ribosome maturation factor RimP